MKRLSLALFVSSMGCAPQTITNPAGPEDDVDIEHDWEQDEEGDCPDSWLLTYSINGRIDITDTPLNIGNAEAFVGGLDQDEIVLRVEDDGGSPAVGQVLLTHFSLLQDFDVSINMIGEITIITDLLTSSANECGVASGLFEGESITWDACDFGSDHGTPNWTPDDAAYGAGCMENYHVEGIVDCLDSSLLASCSDGWFEDGQNPMDYVHNQPLLNFEFDSNELNRFTMNGTSYGTELPTFSNNRTWLSLEGALKSMELTPTPDCLCDE